MSKYLTQTPTSDETASGQRARLPPDRGRGPWIVDIPFPGLLADLERQQVGYLVLRDTPTSAGRDLDLLVDPRDEEGFLACCETFGFRLLRDDWLNPGKIVLVKWDSDRTWLLDAHFQLVSRGLTYMCAATVLERRVREGDCFVPSPEDRLLTLLLHNLIGKRQLQPKHVPALADALAQALDDRYLETHASRFGLGGLVTRARASFALLAADPAAARRLGEECVSAILKAQPRQRLNLARLAFRRMRGARTRRSHGVLVAFMGPDGTGKSTTIEATNTLLNEAGISTRLVYLGPWGQMRLSLMAGLRALGLIPRLGPPTGALRSTSALVRFVARRKNDVAVACYFSVLLVELWYRYLRFVRPVLRAGRVVLADRYIYDIEAAFRAKPVHGYAVLRRGIARCYPRPYLGVLLSAHPEIIRARKAQIAAEDLPRILENYHEVGRRHGFVTLDTSDRLGSTVQAFREACLPALLARLSAPPTSLRRP